MNYVSGIISILIGLFILSLSYQGISGYFGGNAAELEKFRKLKSEGQTTLGILDSMYSETKVGGARIYSVKYKFEVEDKEYEGNHSFDHPDSLQSSFVQVTYLSNEPSIFTSDIEKAIAKAEEDSESSFGLILGLIGLLLAAIILRSGIGRFKQPKTVDYN